MITIVGVFNTEVDIEEVLKVFHNDPNVIVRAGDIGACYALTDTDHKFLLANLVLLGCIRRAKGYADGDYWQDNLFQLEVT